jgi:hypothetical protein
MNFEKMMRDFVTCDPYVKLLSRITQAAYWIWMA